MVTVLFKCRRFYVATERAFVHVDFREMLIPKPHNSSGNTAESRAKVGDFDEADKEQHLVLVSEIPPPPRSSINNTFRLHWCH